MSYSKLNPAWDRMHRTKQIGEQPARCVKCGKAVRPGRGDPCDCTRKLLHAAAQVLRAKTGHAVELECQECGSVGPHDVNDDRREPTALCAVCGMQFDVLSHPDVKES